MNITNVQHLPYAFEEAVKSDYQTAPNEYRVTSLLKGMRETILERRYDKHIDRDVSEMIWLIFGTAVHSLLEKQPKKEGELREVRLQTLIGGKIISGKFDSYESDTKTLTDYKTASVWKVIYGDYSDWRRQLLIYAYLLKLNGYEVTKGRIVALLKDHKKNDAKYKPDYPQNPVVTIEFFFNDQDFADIAEWLSKKVQELTLCESLPDDELPICTPAERFNRDAGYAVMKKGRKTALRVLPTEEAAQQWQADNGGDSIEYRPGKDGKCEDYCVVKEYCNYYKGGEIDV